MRNQILQDVLALEVQLKKLDRVSVLNATIKTDSKIDLEDAAKQLSVHVYEPFETSKEINVHHFKYCIPGTQLCITVKHTEEYRFKKELVPV